ncbi:MAG: hypothetical protein BWX80_01772 [Candidatus Hydrogenedentes bacterium ADurb.Bin101]|nr:MAG: hypothetical protein BWX80_01772 [Candidatus Hydrogenedentes bacterium ADurb.Bin101]
MIGRRRRNIHHFLEDDRILQREHDGGAFLFGGGIHLDQRGLSLQFQVYRAVPVRLLDAAHRLDAVEVHVAVLGFKGSNEVVVGLVVGVKPHHQLGIGAVLIRQFLVPHFLHFVLAPVPEFLALENPVVADQGDAGIPAVVNPAHEVLAGLRDKKRHWLLGLLPPGQVFSMGIVHRLVHLVRHGPAGKLGDIVEVHHVHIRRKNKLVIIVDMDRHVGKVQGGVLEWGDIHASERQLYIGLAGFQRHTRHPARPASLFIFPHPDRFAPVIVVLNSIVHRNQAGGAVVVRGIPFHAAGSPRTDGADQGGFHDMVVIHDLIVVGFIQNVIQAAAHLRGNADLQVFILEDNGLVYFVQLFGVLHIIEGIGINVPLRQLHLLRAKEERYLVRGFRLIGGQDDGLFG